MSRRIRARLSVSVGSLGLLGVLAYYEPLMALGAALFVVLAYGAVLTLLLSLNEEPAS